MSYSGDRRAPDKVVARLRLVCLEFPEVTEERAWVGTRWCVRRKNFAHVLMIQSGWPPAYARAAGTRGPACVLTFRLDRENCRALRFRRAPFFRPPWFPNIAGMLLDSGTDWDEVDVLLRASYRMLAPRKLAVLVE
jgi:hypothetical protein